MSKIIDIYQQAEKKYAGFLRAYIMKDFDNYFPMSIKFSRPKNSESREEQKRKIEYLENNSKQKLGFGYEIYWKKTIKSREKGEITLPDKILFYDIENFLLFINKLSDFKTFKFIISNVISEIPELRAWILKNPLIVNKQKGMWDDLIKVCKYFLFDHIQNKYYIRELPINIHTKFIENNKPILNSLLTGLLPDGNLNTDYSGKIKNNSFEKRYFLKYDKSLIRFRILDLKLYISGNISDISLTPDEFNNLNFKCDKIFIAENKLNILTFPNIEDSVIIFGSGKGIKQIKDADWIFDKQLYYWGDIDVQGFEILDQLRSYNTKANIISIMMDFDTLNKFENDISKGKSTKIENLNYLTEVERKIYEYVKENNLRLEQEKIGHEYVKGYFKRIETTF